MDLGTQKLEDKGSTELQLQGIYADATIYSCTVFYAAMHTKGVITSPEFFDSQSSLDLISVVKADLHTQRESASIVTGQQVSMFLTFDPKTSVNNYIVALDETILQNFRVEKGAKNSFLII